MTRSEAIELSNPILHPIERKVFSYIRHNYCMGSTRWQFVISRLHLAPKKDDAWHGIIYMPSALCSNPESYCDGSSWYDLSNNADFSEFKERALSKIKVAFPDDWVPGNPVPGTVEECDIDYSFPDGRFLVSSMNGKVS